MAGLPEQNPPIWEVEMDTGWQEYNADVARKIAEAEARRCGTVAYEAKGRRYEIDLRSMVQVDQLSGSCRSIRRRLQDAAAGESELCLPSVEVRGELGEYFKTGYLDGELYSGPTYRQVLDPGSRKLVLEHQASGVKVWTEALDLRAEAPEEPVVVLYHYLDRLRFLDAASDGALDAEIFALLWDRGWRGIWASSQEPEALNGNAPPMPARSGSGCFSQSALGSRIYSGCLCQSDPDFGKGLADAPSLDFCIPILAPHGLVRSLWGREERDVWVLRLPEGGGPVPQKTGSEAGEAKIERARKRKETLDEALGPDHADTLAAIGELAALLLRTGELEEAERLHRQRLKALEEREGPAHFETLDAVHGLAVLLRAMGRLEEAEACHRRAFQAREEVLGSTHPSTMVSANSLATLLQNMGRLKEAEELFRRSIALLEEARGPEHPETLLFVGNLATVLIAAARYAEAEPLCHRALKGRTKTLGPAHPDTLTAVNELALLLQGLRRYNEAEAHFRCTLQIQEETFGPRHPDTLISVNNLAVLLQAAGKPAEAEPLQRRLLRACEETLGPQHPDTLVNCGHLADLLLQLPPAASEEEGDVPEKGTRFAEAEELLRRSFDGLEKQLGHSHEHTRGARHALVELLKRTGRRKEAQGLRRRRSGDEEALGQVDESTAEVTCRGAGPGRLFACL